MSVPALNVEEIAALKRLADFYSMSTADFVRDILRTYIEQAEQEKQKRLHTRRINVEKASPEESAELMALIDSMTEEDHEIMSVHKIVP